MLMQSCGDDLVINNFDNAEYYNTISAVNTLEYGDKMVEFPKTITASLRDESSLSKISYSEEANVLKTSWIKGDRVSLSINGYSSYHALYQASLDADNVATFSLVDGTNYSDGKYKWIYYYPGDKFNSDVTFSNFSYTGQVQKKGDPYGHLDGYHTMRRVYDGKVDKVDFSSGNQSSCMKFMLRGMEFDNPTKITMVYKEGGIRKKVFVENNKVPGGGYTDDGLGSDDIKWVSSLDLELSGYGTEPGINAYMMMSCYDVTLKQDGVISVYVKCGDGNTYVADYKLTSGMTLRGGRMHTLAIKTGWKIDNSLDYKYPDYDGQVVELQTASKGKGIDLVIMGDGFIEEDFEGNTYAGIMEQAYTEFFNVEPFKSFQDYWNVYYIKTVSQERIAAEPQLNGAINKPCNTRFSTMFEDGTTHMEGDNELALEIAKTAFKSNADERIKKAVVVIMSNLKTHAGTCHNYNNMNASNDYGETMAVAYCALGHNDADRLSTITHEVNGHGFGKLADEYTKTGKKPSSTQTFLDLQKLHTAGYYRNVDVCIGDFLHGQLKDDVNWPLTTKDNVYWSDMFNNGTNDYEAFEGLGFFDGAYTYEYGFCRPTEKATESFMNQNSGQFNAPSRRAIFYRIRALAGINVGDYFKAEEYQAFLDWDKTYIASRSLSKASAKVAKLPEGLLPLGEPQNYWGEWVDGRFVPVE